MLYEYLNRNRSTLIERCVAKAAKRHTPTANDRALADGIPMFLDQIIRTLQIERGSHPLRSREISGPSGGDISASSEMGLSARNHGRELWHHGFTIERVVHNYGDLCQAITDLAIDEKVTIEVEEFRTLNRCLDNAIADCATGFNDGRDQAVADRNADAFNERLGDFAHELRNLITTATLVVSAMRTGHVGLSGPTGSVLDRCLIGLRTLVDRSLADVRLAAAKFNPGQLMSLVNFLVDVEVSARLEAQAHGCVLTVLPVNSRLAVAVDQEMLFAAVGNLLQNAFKFTAPHSEVLLRSYVADDRILIEVEDNCGGLPAGEAERLFLPFTQNGKNRTGLGLGLSIARRGIEASGGTLSVRDLPGKGCIFIIDLPRHELPEAVNLSAFPRPR